MKEIRLKVTEEFFERLDKIRRKEAPKQRNKTFCRDLLEAVVEVFESQEKKRKRKKPLKKRSKKV
tara:strand:- start:323 stop:517 length:195 start_codon:yes stop_codon:yes gene_type:complete